PYGLLAFGALPLTSNLPFASCKSASFAPTPAPNKLRSTIGESLACRDQKQLPHRQLKSPTRLQLFRSGLKSRLSWFLFAHLLPLRFGKSSTVMSRSNNADCFPPLN